MLSEDHWELVGDREQSLRRGPGAGLGTDMDADSKWADCAPLGEEWGV